MSFTPQIKKLDEQHVLTMHTRAKMEDIGAALGGILPKVFAHVQAQGVQQMSPPFARYTNMSDGQVDIDAGAITAEPVPGTEDIRSWTMPKCDAAMTVHVGAYDKLGDTYDKLHEWIKGQGREAVDGAWELYVTDPETTPQDAWRTEVYQPLV